MATRVAGLVFLSGGDGDDALSGPTAGGTGDDGPPSEYMSASRFLGGAGRDVIVGSSTADTIDGGPGPDDLSGGSGGFDSVVYADRTEPLAIDVTDAGTDGDDDGGASDQAVAGGRRDLVVGIDGIVGGAGADVLTGGDSRNLLIGGAGADELAGGRDGDVLCGDGGPDSYPPGMYLAVRCEGGNGDDRLDGGDGDDTLIGSRGADVLAGGPGFDVTSWSEVADGVLKVSILDACPAACAKANDGLVDANPDLAGNQPEGDKVELDVEGILGGLGDDTLTGGSGDDLIAGGGGSDTVGGGGGNDTLCGDDYDRNGYDPYSAYSCRTREPYGGPTPPAPPGVAADVVNGGPGDDELFGGDGADTLAGGTGVDGVSYRNRSGALAVTIAEPTGCAAPPCARANDGTADTDPATAGNQSEGDLVGLDVENVTGGDGADSLSGSAAANLLVGEDGSDTLSGLAGNDHLAPGIFSNDVIKGGSGFDLASYADAHYGGGVHADTDGEADDGALHDKQNIHTDVEGIIGSAYGDTLAGSATLAQANTLVGLGGPDTLTGHGGNDSLSGGAGTDGLFGGAGNDLLSSVDGESDTDDCGAGTLDQVTFDAPSPGVTDTLIGCEASGQTAVPGARAGTAVRREYVGDN